MNINLFCLSPEHPCRWYHGWPTEVCIIYWIQLINQPLKSLIAGSLWLWASPSGKELNGVFSTQQKEWLKLEIEYFELMHCEPMYIYSIIDWLLRHFNSSFSYLPTPPLGQDMTQGQFFKRSFTGLNSEFSLTSCLTKTEEPSLPYYLLIAGGRINGFIPFLRVLVLCEMQSVSSRIWTRIAVSISYDYNHYTMGTYIRVSSSFLCLKVMESCSLYVHIYVM